MCDILVALPNVTSGSKVLFGKNSDRPKGECQVLYYGPARDSASEVNITCSYLRLKAPGRAFATIGCRPYWCRGYETGVNEKGVVGGNTAIFTKSMHQSEFMGTPGLTGMDLLRFGLEQGASAEQAVEIIVELLEKHGQWGSAVAGLSHDKGAYENAFLIADRNEVWILETTGKRWVARKIDAGFYALSNQPTIRNDWTRSSEDLESYASDNGWWRRDREPFDFSYVYGDHEHYARQVSHIRWKRVNEMLRRAAGEIDIPTIMSILRDHYEDTFLEGPQFHPYLPDFHTICMHDSPAGFTWGDTATSFIVEIDPESEKPPDIWFAYLPPCTSIYSGLFWSEKLPDLITATGTAGLTVQPPIEASIDSFRETSLWWRFFRVVDAVRGDPHRRSTEAISLFRQVERDNLRIYDSLRGGEVDNQQSEQFLENQLQRVVNALSTIERRWRLS